MTKEQIDEVLKRKAFHSPSRLAELIETHISWVILTDDYAYKIKKPVRYAFLDFSTLEQRRYYCNRELVLNARLTSHMYLDVLPVTQTATGPVIGKASGEVIDYALLMRRMDESRQMNHLLARRLLTREHLRRIAGQLADFHHRAAIEPGSERPDLMEERFADLLSVKDLIAERLGKQEAKKLREIVYLAGRFVKKHAPRIQVRNQEGWVVDGHGDLHSKNILLLDKPVIFDCIEFNDAFRQLDVLNEVGFFCMDLDYYGYRRAAACFLRDYLNRFECMTDPADWRLFLFFKAYRANVRLKVNALRAMQADGEPEVQEVLPLVRDYFALLNGYCEELRSWKLDG